MAERSSYAKLQARIALDRGRIAAGERPLYQVTWTTAADGSTADVMIEELPLIHVFVPEATRVLDGARGLIARTLGVDPASFDVAAGARRS
jgi:hypothetical protein